MGTNFYLCHIPNVEQHQKMQKLLIDKQYEQLKELLKNSTRKYHIGKRSCGWQFLFAPHVSELTYERDNPWENTLKSLREVLSNLEYIIQDEYGTHYTSEEFWQEIKPCLYNDKEHINGKQYYERNPSELPCTSCEFTTEEGLRFST